MLLRLVMKVAKGLSQVGARLLEVKMNIKLRMHQR